MKIVRILLFRAFMLVASHLDWLIRLPNVWKRGRVGSSHRSQRRVESLHNPDQVLSGRFSARFARQRNASHPEVPQSTRDGNETRYVRPRSVQGS